jgi:hypothetical protein
MFSVDTLRRTFSVRDHDVVSDAVGSRRVHLRLEDGFPDGTATVIDPDMVTLNQLRLQGGFAPPEPPGGGSSGSTPKGFSIHRRWSPTTSRWTRSKGRSRP